MGPMCSPCQRPRKHFTTFIPKWNPLWPPLEFWDEARNPCDVFRNQYPLSMKGRNADNVCFPTIEPHRRCDSEAEPMINVCFTWLVAFLQDVNAIQSDQIALSDYTHSCQTTSYIQWNPLEISQLISAHLSIVLQLRGFSHFLLHTDTRQAFEVKCTNHNDSQRPDKRSSFCFCLHLSECLAPCLPPFLFLSISPKHIWLWEEGKQPRAVSC